MANEKQFKTFTKIIATRGVEEYRQTIQQFVKPEDKILEFGCEWGTTSVEIFNICKNLIATDISKDCIKQAREKHPEVHFEELGVFNIKQAMNLGVDFNKMFFDISGLSSYRALLDVIALLDMYSKVFNLELIVVKSGSLKQFANNLSAWKNTNFAEQN